MTRASVLLAVLAAAPAWGAKGYAVYSHPQGVYSVEFPADWRRAEGADTLSLRPPGRRGNQVRVLLEYRPAGKTDAAAVRDFMADLEGDPLTKVVERLTQRVAGRLAARVSRVETAGAGGKDAPDGPLRESIVVVPGRHGTLVVRLAGVGDEFAKTLPEFDRLLSRLTLASPKK